MCKCQRHYQYANEFISRNHLQCNTLCVTLRPSMSARIPHTFIHCFRIWWTQFVCVRASELAFGCYFCVRCASQLNRVKIEGVQRITISIACCFRLCFSSQKFVFYLYLFNGSRLNVCIDDAWRRPPYINEHLSIHGRAFIVGQNIANKNKRKNPLNGVDREPVGTENVPCGVNVSSVFFSRRYTKGMRMNGIWSVAMKRLIVFTWRKKKSLPSLAIV